MSHGTEHTNRHTSDAVYAAMVIAGEPLPESDTFVSFQVRSCILLVGPAAPVLEMARSLRHQFHVVALIDGPKPQSRLLGVSIVSAQLASLTGHLGQFSATARNEDGQPVDLAAKSNNDDGYFDLVLDLSLSPVLDRPIPPLGYLRPGDPGQYEAVLADIPILNGEFHKPKYFNFEPRRCIHRRQEVSGCDRCLDVCPAAAISTGQYTINIDAHLCRGCGTCTAVCPTGAVSYADPPLMLLIDRLARMLQAFRVAGDAKRPWIGFHAGNSSPIKEWASGQGITLLPFPVHSVTSLGLEAWFAAIGLGAAGVILQIPASAPAMVIDTLTGQAELAGKILDSLGHSHAQVILLHDNTADPGLDDTAQPYDMASDETWAYPSANLDPRARMQKLFDQLSSISPQGIEENAIVLPGWATLGGVELDTDACTMCMACTTLCPTGALRPGQDGMELGFIEAACLQCGLCEHGCPEGAIKRQPRFDYEALRGSSMITLNRAQMANCTQCGQPFMSTALLASALKHLTGDSAAIQEAKQMLQVCPHCRASSTLQAQFPKINGSPDQT